MCSTRNVHISIHFHIIHKSVRRFGAVLCLDEQQLVAQQSIHDTLIVPRCHDRLQIQIRREEAHNTIGDAFGRLYQQLAIVPDNGGVIACFEFGRNRHLIVTFGYNLEAKLIRNQMKKYLSHTIGSRQGLASVIVKELITAGSKSSIFGYISIGDSVPEVITTL